MLLHFYIGLYCKACKLDGMTDVISKRCMGFECGKQPNFNYPGEKRPLYCKNCKLDRMVNVVSKRCDG
eukprot:Pgem_evm1s18075